MVEVDATRKKMLCRHFKGGYYLVEEIASLSKSGVSGDNDVVVRAVVYRPLYYGTDKNGSPITPNSVYIREETEFFEDVVFQDKSSTKRFEVIDSLDRIKSAIRHFARSIPQELKFVMENPEISPLQYLISFALENAENYQKINFVLDELSSEDRGTSGYIPFFCNKLRTAIARQAKLRKLPFREELEVGAPSEIGIFVNH